MRSRHHLEVATWATVQEVATWRSRHEIDVATWATVWKVATWKRCRDIGEAPGGRDMKLMSRHRVATWLEAGQEKRCRDTDLMSRHDYGCLNVATSK